MDDLEQKKRESELATQQAEQRKAELEAEEAEAKRDKALQETQKATAEAEQARAAATTAQNSAAGDPETDPEVVEARRQARLAALAKETADSEAAVRKAAIPELPTIATIAEPEDKSPKVETDAGTAAAELTAATALEVTGAEIAGAVIAALREANIAAGDVWLVDDFNLALHDIERQVVKQRLSAFNGAFLREPPAAPQAAAAQAGPPVFDLGLLSFALGTGSSLARFGVELAGALRSRYALYGRTPKLSRPALVTAALRSLAKSAPSTLTFRHPGLATVSESELLTSFATACTNRDVFEVRHLSGPEPAKDSPLQPSRQLAKALVASFDAYATAITAVPEGQTISPLVPPP